MNDAIGPISDRHDDIITQRLTDCELDGVNGTESIQIIFCRTVLDQNQPPITDS
jgi:hypothetical protein